MITDVKLTCTCNDCPCLLRAHEIAEKNGGVFDETFTHEDEEFCQWNQDDFPDCKHVPAKQKSAAAKAVPITKIALAAGIVVLAALIWSFASGGGDGGDEDGGVERGAVKDAEQILVEHFNSIFTVLKR